MQPTPVSREGREKANFRQKSSGLLKPHFLNPSRPSLKRIRQELGVSQRPLTLILLEKYRDTNGSRIAIQIGGVYTTFCQEESILLQKYRDRNGTCIAILFKRRRHINVIFLVRLPFGRRCGCPRNKPGLSLGQTHTLSRGQNPGFSLFYTIEAQFVPGANPVCHWDNLGDEGRQKEFIWARTQRYCKRGSGGQRKIEKIRTTFWDSQKL